MGYNHKNWSAVRALYVRQSKSGYYIHHKVSNIGRVGRIRTRSELEDGQVKHAHDMADYRQITKEFSNQKSYSITALKTQYKTLFLKNTNLSANGLDLVGNAYNNKRGEKIVTEINTAIATQLQSQIDIESIKQLIDTKVVHKEDKSTRSKKTTLQHFFNNHELKDRCKYVDDYFEAIIKCIEIVGGPYSVPLILSLQNMLTKEGGGRTSKGYGQDIKEAIDNYNDIVKYTVINPGITSKIEADTSFNQMEQVVSMINSFADTLIKGKTNKGKALSDDVLKHMFQTIRAGIGELIASKIVDITNTELYISLEDEITKINNSKTLGNPSSGVIFTGNTMKVELKTPGKTGDYTDGKTYNKKEYGKADLLLKNVAFHLSESNTDITLDIGISNKLYTTASNNIFKTKGSKGNTFSFGGGMDVGTAIDMSFSQVNKRYLAYNTFAWEDDTRLKDSLYALQDIIFRRSLINLVGAREGSDLALMIVMNGEFVPLWDLVMFAAKNDLGRSASDRSNKNALKFSIGAGTGRENIKINPNNREQVATPRRKGESDSVYINRVIEAIKERKKFMRNGLANAKISAKLNPVKLLNAKSRGYEPLKKN